MNECIPHRNSARDGARQSANRILLDARNPKLLDHRGYVLQVVAGHVDVFAVRAFEGTTQGPRHHLFRIESGEIIPDLQHAVDSSGGQLQIVAVGGPGAEVLVVPRQELQSLDPVARWIANLARLVAGPNPSWEMGEASPGDAMAMQPGERRRGPARNIVWVTLKAGTAKLMGIDPAFAAGDPPIPLTSGMWIEAGHSGALPSRTPVYRIPTRCGARSINSILPSFHVFRNGWYVIRSAKPSASSAAAKSRRCKHSNLLTACPQSLFDASIAPAWMRTARILSSPLAGWSEKQSARRSSFLSGRLRPERTSPTLSRSRGPRDCASAGRCCEVNGGSWMWGPWWHGTAMSANPSPLSAARAIVTQ